MPIILIVVEKVDISVKIMYVELFRSYAAFDSFGHVHQIISCATWVRVTSGYNTAQITVATSTLRTPPILGDKQGRNQF